MNYLRGITMPDKAHQIVLEDYVIAVDAGVARVKRLVAHMGQGLETWSRKPHVEALMAYRGFQTVAAMTVISELGDLSRRRKAVSTRSERGAPAAVNKRSVGKPVPER